MLYHVIGTGRDVQVDIMHMLTNSQRTETRGVYGEMSWDKGRTSHPLKVADNEVSNIKDETLTFSTLSPFARVERGIIHFDIVNICMICNMSFAIYKQHLHICHLMLYHVIGTGHDWIQKIIDVLNKEMIDDAPNPDMIYDDTYLKLCAKYSEHVRNDTNMYVRMYQKLCDDKISGFALLLRTDLW
jgi:hypothetical protein